MTGARSEVVVDGVEMGYHVVSRCVRRAFLCGMDHYNNRDPSGLARRMDE